MIFVVGDTICPFTAEHNLGVAFAVARRFEPWALYGESIPRGGLLPPFFVASVVKMRYSMTEADYFEEPFS